jgi:hypothetical protein
MFTLRFLKLPFQENVPLFKTKLSPNIKLHNVYLLISTFQKILGLFFILWFQSPVTTFATFTTDVHFPIWHPLSFWFQSPIATFATFTTDVYFPIWLPLSCFLMCVVSRGEDGSFILFTLNPPTRKNTEYLSSGHYPSSCLAWLTTEASCSANIALQVIRTRNLPTTALIFLNDIASKGVK